MGAAPCGIPSYGRRRPATNWPLAHRIYHNRQRHHEPRHPHKPERPPASTMAPRTERPESKARVWLLSGRPGSQGSQHDLVTLPGA